MFSLAENFSMTPVTYPLNVSNCHVSGSIHQRMVLGWFWNCLGRNLEVVMWDSSEMCSGVLFQKMISE